MQKAIAVTHSKKVDDAERAAGQQFFDFW